MVAMQAKYEGGHIKIPALPHDTYFNIPSVEVDAVARSTWKILGQGSYGQVLLANLHGRKVAVKCLKPSLTYSACEAIDSSTAQDMCLQHIWNEIMMLQCLQHPHIVSYVGAARTQDNLFLMTEFCARGSVDRILHRPGQQPLHHDRILNIARHTVRAMVHMHKNAILHCDLKPANLLVTADWKVKVADFGNSRFVTQPGCLDQEATVEYCAPEVLAGGAFTMAADVWSFGVTLWELLNQERPYQECGLNRYMLIMQIASGVLTLPAIPAGHASDILIRIVQACLDPCPDARPTFEDILEMLNAEPRPTSTMPSSLYHAPISSVTLAAVHHSDLTLASKLTQIQPYSSTYEGCGKLQPLSSESLCQTPRNASAPPSPMSSPFATARGAVPMSPFVCTAAQHHEGPFKSFAESASVEPSMCGFSNDSNAMSDVTEPCDLGMLSSDSSVLSTKSTSILVSSGPWTAGNDDMGNEMQNADSGSRLSEEVVVRLQRAVYGDSARKHRKVHDVYRDMAFDEVVDETFAGDNSKWGWGVRDSVSGRVPVSCTCSPNTAHIQNNSQQSNDSRGMYASHACSLPEQFRGSQDKPQPYVFSTSRYGCQGVVLSSTWFGSSHTDTVLQRSERALLIDKG